MTSSKNSESADEQELTAGKTAVESSDQAKPKKTLAVWIATGFGFGFSPFASGTVGGLWGIPLAIGIIGYVPDMGPIPAWVLHVVITTILFAFGVPLCTKAANDLGGKKDPGAITWDEIVSMPITFFLVSPSVLLCPFVIIIGFCLNRFFDILKPPPARQLEALPDGLGIMIDDLFAGIYSCLALHLLIYMGLFDKMIEIYTGIMG